MMEMKGEEIETAPDQGIALVLVRMRGMVEMIGVVEEVITTGRVMEGDLRAMIIEEVGAGGREMHTAIDSVKVAEVGTSMNEAIVRVEEVVEGLDTLGRRWMKRS